MFFFHDLRKRRAVLAQEGHPCVACPEKIPHTCFRRFFGRPHIVSGPGIGETILGEAPLHITTDCGPDLAVPLNMAQRALSDPKVKNCGERNHIVREQHNMTWWWVFFPPLSRTSALRCTRTLHFKMRTVLYLRQVGWSQSGGLAQLQSETSDVVHVDPIHAESLERFGTRGVDCCSSGGDVKFAVDHRLEALHGEGEGAREGRKGREGRSSSSCTFAWIREL